MKRWVAVIFLLLTAFYLGASAADHCGERPPGEAQVCHVLCNDGCATAPIPIPPQAPRQDPLPQPNFETERVEHLMSLAIEPETDPPRV
jgi:hypothetical protein